mgnify:CR=1 FL=1
MRDDGNGAEEDRETFLLRVAVEIGDALDRTPCADDCVLVIVIDVAVSFHCACFSIADARHSWRIAWVVGRLSSLNSVRHASTIIVIMASVLAKCQCPATISLRMMRFMYQR